MNDPRSTTILAANYRDGRARSVRVLKNRTTYDYGVAATRVVDALGRATTFYRDESGTTVGVLDPLGNLSTVGFDEYLRPVAVDRNGQRFAIIEYDGYGRLMRLRNASIGYDEEGRPTLPPSSMLFEYDAEGRLSQVRRSVDNPAVTDKQFSSKAEPIAEYRYDSRGRLVSAIDSAGERAYEYDSSSRLAAVILEGGKTHLRMDDDGRIQELLSDGRPRLRYVYASAGRVASINFVGEHSASYDYDPRGFRRTASYGHGFTSHMRYDSAGNLIRYSLSNANGAITSQEYEIGDNNEVLHIHNTAQATQAPSISFRYDEAGRLLGAETGPRFLATEYDALELSVPMLAKVLQEGDRSYRSIIADGLVRQGSLAAVDVLTRNLGRFGDGEEGQWFDELLYRSLRQIAYPDISAWLLVRNPPDREAQNRAKKIVDRTYRGFMIID